MHNLLILVHSYHHCISFRVLLSGSKREKKYLVASVALGRLLFTVDVDKSMFCCRKCKAKKLAFKYQCLIKCALLYVVTAENFFDKVSWADIRCWVFMLDIILWFKTQPQLTTPEVHIPVALIKDGRRVYKGEHQPINAKMSNHRKFSTRSFCSRYF